jgi:hypothetical protein
MSHFLGHERRFATRSAAQSKRGRGRRGKASWLALAGVAVVAAAVASFTGASAQNAWAQPPVKGLIPIEEALSAGGVAALFGPSAVDENPQPGYHDNGRGGNTFVNDPCLDPPSTAAPPENRRRTVQSETEIAVLNTAGSMGKKMVAGYNDSYGFYNDREGLSGYAYSTNGGNTWIDGGGLPPRTSGGPFEYSGDPVVIVHHKTQRFFYSSIYRRDDGTFTLSVNRGEFKTAPPQGVESIANTRCLNDPSQFGVPDPPQQSQERMVWELPVEAVPTKLGEQNDLLDKEWLYVDQTTGTLYLTYTRFEDALVATTATPLELMRCRGCAFNATFTSADWDGPFTIVPNELDEFNQATMPITTPSGRVIVTWFARHFSAGGLGPEDQQKIEYAYSDDDGMTWTDELPIAVVNPQGEPPGYNRGRASILNAPYMNVDKGSDDGTVTSTERGRAGFGNIYVTYFSGKTPVLAGPPFASQADVFMSRSTDDGLSFGPMVQMNDDDGRNSHVFPTVQVNKNGIVYADWLDRRRDASNNRLTDAWANVSKNNGTSFGPDRLQTDVATGWFVRADARPNFGDYNSSDLLGFNDFVIIWADGRFPPPAPATNAATPDTIFSIANGLGVGNLSK